MPRGAICLTFFRYTIRQGLCELAAQFFAKVCCLLLSKLFNNNALSQTKLLLILSTQFIRIARNKLFQIGICLSLERERVNSKQQMEDIVEVRKVNKDGNWMDGLLVQLLFIFHLLCSSFAFLSDTKGRENNLQTFFNNETSMRHCLKLLGIQAHQIFLKNSVCQVIVTSISEIFACNM